MRQITPVSEVGQAWDREEEQSTFLSKEIRCRISNCRSWESPVCSESPVNTATSGDGASFLHCFFNIEFLLEVSNLKISFYRDLWKQQVGSVSRSRYPSAKSVFLNLSASAFTMQAMSIMKSLCLQCQWWLSQCPVLPHTCSVIFELVICCCQPQFSSLFKHYIENLWHLKYKIR